ncbi:hypothetical protein AGMMS49525_11730 [Bacteroidia bacterium]|nr:hypothetical protein AGMMS49525_11730 [Bacteroidia bacterium]
MAIPPLHYEISADDEKFLDAIIRDGRALNNLTREAEQAGSGIEDAFKKVAAVAGISFGIGAIKNFGSEIIRVRSEIQMLEQSFTVLLGSKAKSDVMLKEIKDIALKSPLLLTDTSQAAQTLLSFNVSAEKIIPTLRQLGDISMGNSARFGALSLAFAQMSSAGKLMGQDLLQMINAGFNPLQIMAEKTGKSIATLKEEMSKGAISSEMVADAFAAATAEGGKFHNMMETQASGIAGLQASLGDAWMNMLNDMGESSEGIIAGGYKVATGLVENYEKVGKAIAAIIATYGAYRAAVALNAVATNGWTIAQAAQYKGLLMLEKAQKLFNATALANPYVFLATVIIGVVAAMWAFHDSSTAAEKAQNKLNDTLEEQKNKKDALKNKTSELIGIITDETQTIYAQIKAWKELQKEMPESFGKMTLEDFKKLSPEERSIKINIEIEKKSEAEFEKSIEDQIKKVERLKKGVVQYGFQGSKTTVIDQKELETAEELLILLQKEKKEREEIAQKAEFDAKPAQERINYYNQELEKLEQEKMKLDELAVKYTKLENSTTNITGEWGSINLESIQLLNNLDLIVRKQKEMQAGKASVEASIIGDGETYKSAFSAAEKAWKEAQKTLSEAKNKTKKEYEDASNNLKAAKEAFEKLGGKTTTTKDDDRRKNELQKQLDAQLKMHEQERQNAIDNQKFYLEMAQKDTDIMSDSWEKKYKQIVLNHAKEELELKQFQENQLKKQQEFERQQWEAAGKKGTFTPATKTIGDLTATDKSGNYVFPDVANQIKAMTSAVKAEFEKANADFTELSEKAANEELLRLDTSLNAELVRIKESYKERLDAAKGNAAETAALEANQALEIATAMTDSNIQKLEADNEYYAQSQELARNSYQFEADLELAKLQNTKKTQQAIIVELEKLAAAEKKSKGFVSNKTLENLRQAKLGLEETNAAIAKMPMKKWNELSTQLKKCKSEIDNIIGSMDGLDESTKSALQAASNIAGGTIAMIDGIKKVAIDAALGIKAVENASVILAIIGAAVQIITAIFNMASNAEKAHAEALEKIQKSKIAMQREYNLLLLEQNELLQKAVTIFGTDVYGEAIGSVDQYKKALSELKEEIKGTNPIDLGKKMGAVTLSTGKFYVGFYKEMLADYEKGVLGLSSLYVKTGHKKTGLFGWGSGKDIYSDLLTVFPDLINEAGEFDKEVAKIIISTKSGLMSEEDVDTLQHMVDLAELAEKAFEGMKDYLTSIFGDLGSTMSDALTDAFKNGTDASKVFSDSVTSMLEKLAQDMIYSVTLAPIFEEAQKQMLETMKDEKTSDKQKFAKYSEIMEGVLEEAEAAKELAMDMYKEYQDIAKKNDIELWKPDEEAERAGMSGKGLAQASQDSINEMTGILRAGNMINQQIKEWLDILTPKSSELLAINNETNSHLFSLTTIAQDQLATQRQIEMNTRKIENMNNAIVDIQLHGVKIIT